MQRDVVFEIRMVYQAIQQRIFRCTRIPEHRINAVQGQAVHKHIDSTHLTLLSATVKLYPNTVTLTQPNENISLRHASKMEHQALSYRF